MKKIISILIFLTCIGFITISFAESALNEADYYGIWYMKSYFDGNKTVEVDYGSASSKTVLFLRNQEAIVTFGNGEEGSQYFASWVLHDNTIDLTYEDGDSGVFTIDNESLVYATGRQKQYFVRERRTLYEESETWLNVDNAFYVPILKDSERVESDTFAVVFWNAETNVSLGYLFYRFDKSSFENAHALADYYSDFTKSIRDSYPYALYQLFEINGYLAAQLTIVQANLTNNTTETSSIVFFVRDGCLIHMQLDQTSPLDLTAEGQAVILAEGLAKKIVFPEDQAPSDAGVSSQDATDDGDIGAPDAENTGAWYLETIGFQDKYYWDWAVALYGIRGAVSLKEDGSALFGLVVDDNIIEQAGTWAIRGSTITLNLESVPIHLESQQLNNLDDNTPYSINIENAQIKLQKTEDNKLRMILGNSVLTFGQEKRTAIPVLAKWDKEFFGTWQEEQYTALAEDLYETEGNLAHPTTIAIQKGSVTVTYLHDNEEISEDYKYRLKKGQGVLALYGEGEYNGSILSLDYIRGISLRKEGNEKDEGTIIEFYQKIE